VKLELKEGTYYTGQTYYLLEIDFNVYWRQFPRESTWHNKFVDQMDNQFIKPFDFRRVSSWEKSKTRVNFWFAYVSVPERFK
jgi:hypothetical protein